MATHVLGGQVRLLASQREDTADFTQATAKQVYERQPMRSYENTISDPDWRAPAEKKPRCLSLGAIDIGDFGNTVGGRDDEGPEEDSRIAHNPRLALPSSRQGSLSSRGSIKSSSEAELMLFPRSKVSFKDEAPVNALEGDRSLKAPAPSASWDAKALRLLWLGSRHGSTASGKASGSSAHDEFQEQREESEDMGDLLDESEDDRLYTLEEEDHAKSPRVVEADSSSVFAMTGIQPSLPQQFALPPGGSPS